MPVSSSLPLVVKRPHYIRLHWFDPGRNAAVRKQCLLAPPRAPAQPLQQLCDAIDVELFDTQPTRPVHDQRPRRCWRGRNLHALETRTRLTRAAGQANDRACPSRGFAMSASLFALSPERRSSPTIRRQVCPSERAATATGTNVRGFVLV